MTKLIKEIKKGAIVKHEQKDWVVKNKLNSVLELIGLDGETVLTTVEDVNLSGEFNPYAHRTVYDMVKEFHEVFEHKVGDLTPLSMEEVMNRSDYTVEEIVEAIYVTSKNNTEFKNSLDKFIENVTKAGEKVMKTERPSNDLELTVAQGDAFGDQTYLAVGSLVTLLGDMMTGENLVHHIHNANMTKLFTDENGKKYVQKDPVTNKILKSPDFVAPEPELTRMVALGKLSASLQK